MRKLTIFAILLLQTFLTTETISVSGGHQMGLISKQKIILNSCIIGVVCVAACIKIVSTGDQCLVERLGKFHKILNPGLNILVPFIDNVSFKDTVREQVLDIPPQECYTLDNAPLTADAIVYMRITGKVFSSLTHPIVICTM